QALTATPHNIARQKCWMQSGQRGVTRNEDKTTPRFCEIVALKAPQPQSTLTRYYTCTTKRNHQHDKNTNADQISPTSYAFSVTASAAISPAFSILPNGNLTKNVVPRPSSLWNQICPPCFFTIIV